MMPRAESWVPGLSRLFPGAGAPSRFLGRLRRHCSALAAWRRSAAWLPQLLAQRPQLLDLPLFGHTLAAAVQGGEERAETPSPRTAAATPPLPAAPERQRRRSNSRSTGETQTPVAGQPGFPVDRQSRRFAPFAPTPRVRAALPDLARTRIEPSLLAALAGGIALPRLSRQKGARAAVAPPATRGERHLPLAAESGRLVQELIRRLRLAPLTAEKAPAAPGGAMPAAAPATVDLAGQWALPLGGPRVSRAFLEAVLQSAKPGTAELPPGNGEKSRAAAANSPRDAAPTRGGPPPSLGGQPAAAKDGKRGGMEQHTPAADWHPPREATPLFSSRRSEVHSTDASAVRESVSTVRGIETEPAVSPSQFPAGQTEKVFDPTAAPFPLPAAEKTPGGKFFAALRRQPAPPDGAFDRRPAAIPGAVADDLDELAAKLQRILEEQARRHGIDV